MLPGIRNNEVAWGLAFRLVGKIRATKLKLAPAESFIGRVVAHMGEKSDWVLIIHSEDGARNLLFVETSDYLSRVYLMMSVWHSLRSRSFFRWRKDR